MASPRKILVVSEDRLGRTMAGTGVRAYNFARELRSVGDVTLVGPGAPELELEGGHVVGAEEFAARGRAALREFDAVVSQRLNAKTMRYLARTDVKTIYDLYVPTPVENLGFYAADPRPAHYRELAYRSTLDLQRLTLLAGDAFLCASERQRDLWLGPLLDLGRTTPERYAADPTLRDLIDVVPTGLDPEPPAAERGALKGIVPGIGLDDVVLVWGGGIWNWFDPLTPIRAVAELAERRPEVKLVFLGVRHPDPEAQPQAMAARAERLARELGVHGKSVFFTGWMPYAERAAYYVDADLGVSAHFETLEARFSFRTRLLEYLWGELPIVTTGGDVLGDLVAERGLGRVVGAENVGGWVRALEELLEPRAREEAQRNVERTRAEFTWPRVTEPLRRLVAAPRRERTRSRSLAAAFAGYASTGVRSSVIDRGVRGTARHTVSVLRRARLP